MVIPASMNQIHGGAQLIRLVLTSISALMIKTLQKALAQPDAFSRLGGPRSPAPRDRAASAVGPGCPKNAGWELPGPWQQGDSPARPRNQQSLLPSRLAAAAPEVFLGCTRSALACSAGRAGSGAGAEDSGARRGGSGRAGSPGSLLGNE